MIEILKRLFKRKRRNFADAYRVIYKKRQELELVSARIEAKVASAEEHVRLASGKEKEIYLRQRETLNAILSYISKVDLYFLQLLIRLETLMSLSEALEAIKESNAAIKKVGPQLSAIAESYGNILDELKDAVSGIASVSPSWGPPVNLLTDDAERIIDTAYDEIIREAGINLESNSFEDVFERLAEAV